MNFLKVQMLGTREYPLKINRVEAVSSIYEIKKAGDETEKEEERIGGKEVEMKNWRDKWEI